MDDILEHVGMLKGLVVLHSWPVTIPLVQVSVGIDAFGRVAGIMRANGFHRDPRHLACDSSVAIVYSNEDDSVTVVVDIDDPDHELVDGWMVRVGS